MFFSYILKKIEKIIGFSNDIDIFFLLYDIIFKIIDTYI